MTYETELQLKVCFWNCNGYPWNTGIGIDELTNHADIVLLVETWELDAQRIDGREIQCTFVVVVKKSQATQTARMGSMHDKKKRSKILYQL